MAVTLFLKQNSIGGSGDQSRCGMHGIRLIAAAVLLVMCAAPSAHGDHSPLQDVVEGQVKFSTDLYKLMSVSTGNLFYSSLSVHTVLALAYLGARGTTASQMQDALDLPGDDEIKHGFQALMEVIKNVEGSTLIAANKIYVDDGVPLESAFQQLAQAHFAAEVESVDFAHHHQAARGTINKWVEGKTLGRIRELLADDVVAKETVMILLSTMYFKGAWATAFNVNYTRPSSFYGVHKHAQNVSTMYRKGVYGFLQSPELDSKLLELPYKGGELSMVIVLPNTQDGIAELDLKVAALGPERWEELMGALDDTEVAVSLPKFKLQQAHNMRTVLQQRGMRDAFTDLADFSGMSAMPIKINALVHEAFIEVSEEGTEAAVSSGVNAQAKRLVELQTFDADHPFVFVVRDTRSNAILFGGRLADL